VTILLAILGPTAAGKTRMAGEVAAALGELGRAVEIVSCDSMAVYRGLDVVADKPSPADRAAVPHHLIDVVDADVDFTVVQYRELARAAIDGVAERGALPMLVGGSGLYFRGVVDELSFAPTSSEIRARLEVEDPERLYARLRAADPESADRLDPRNVRRVVRAVEVLELTGRRPSELRTEWERRDGPYELYAVGLTWDREELFARAEERIGRQLEAGLVEEVRASVASGLSKTSSQALGLKELVDHIEGRSKLEDVRAELVRSTKAFVRRQLSWFRADPRIQWVNASELGWEGARSAIVAGFGEAAVS
jgi:tRNA dimethylallyltransferase